MPGTQGKTEVEISGAQGQPAAVYFRFQCHAWLHAHASVLRAARWLTIACLPLVASPLRPCRSLRRGKYHLFPGCFDTESGINDWKVHKFVEQVGLPCFSTEWIDQKCMLFDTSCFKKFVFT